MAGSEQSWKTAPLPQHLQAGTCTWNCGVQLCPYTTISEDFAISLIPISPSGLAHPNILHNAWHGVTTHTAAQPSDILQLLLLTKTRGQFLAYYNMSMRPGVSLVCACLLRAQDASCFTHTVSVRGAGVSCRTVSVTRSQGFPVLDIASSKMASHQGTATLVMAVLLW